MGRRDEVLAGLSCQLEIIMYFLHLVRLKGPQLPIQASIFQGFLFNGPQY